jgi:hypothetical protein
MNRLLEVPLKILKKRLAALSKFGLCANLRTDKKAASRAEPHAEWNMR